MGLIDKRLGVVALEIGIGYCWALWTGGMDSKGLQQAFTRLNRFKVL